MDRVHSASISVFWTIGKMFFKCGVLGPPPGYSEDNQGGRGRGVRGGGRGGRGRGDGQQQQYQPRGKLMLNGT